MESYRQSKISADKQQDIGKYLSWADKQDEICEDRQGAMVADRREGTATIRK